MSEEQKYYTPAPEDIRIGMLCEFNTIDAGWETRVLNRHSAWITTNEDNKIRIPYLTAEQIEAEGWGKRTADGKSYYRMFNGGVWFCLYLRGDNEITIVREIQTEESNHGMVAGWDSTKTDLYHGSCRCINDLRLISKMIGI